MASYIVATDTLTEVYSSDTKWSTEVMEAEKSSAEAACT